MLEEHGLSSSTIQVALQVFEEAPEPLNAVLLMMNEADYFQIENPTSIQKDGVRLRYLGRFTCK